MKNKTSLKIISVNLIILLVLISGCTEIINTGKNEIKYEKQPTKVSYNISYGCKINCSGNGEFRINYKCNTPEVMKGIVTDINVLNNEYTDRLNVATFNDMKSWNISKKGSCNSYTFGISADIISEVFYITDLNGGEALKIDEIKDNHSELVKQYCKPQGNDTTVFINPDYPSIKEKAYEIYNSTNSENSFIVAQELFQWLKQNTDYEIHSDNNVQPCYLTFNKKTGDCDDLTFLYLSLCKSLDIPCRFIKGYLIDESDTIGHVWAEVFVGGNLGDSGWIPIECAGSGNKKSDVEIHQNFGMETADHLRLFKDNGSNKSLNIYLSGINYMFDQNIEFNKPVFFAYISDYTVLKEENLVIAENNVRNYI